MQQHQQASLAMYAHRFARTAKPADGGVASQAKQPSTPFAGHQDHRNPVSDLVNIDSNDDLNFRKRLAVAACLALDIVCGHVATSYQGRRTFIH